VKSVLAAATFGLLAAPALAQQSETITVTGRRELPTPVARRFVRQITTSVDGQLTRFNEPVCPLAIGIDDPYAKMIARRIRQVAADAKVRLAPEKCRANVVVIFAADADALVKLMRVKAPELFEGVDDVKEAFRSGPVHAWTATEIRNEDGEVQKGTVLTVKTASIITMPTQQVILGTMIVIDSKAAMGKSLRQIADYAAVRALTGARPPEESVPADTVLTLFNPAVESPPQLTSVDRSYLRALYTGNANYARIDAINRISAQIARESKKDSAKRR